MTVQAAQQFTLLPEWTISQKEKSLIISGGADAKYEIELVSAEISSFSLLKADKKFTRNMLSADDQRVLEELLTAEVVVPVLQKIKDLHVGIVGDKNQLDLPASKDIQKADLLVVVRTTSTYGELLDNIWYQTIKKPHLFVDMAFHHTLSIGPLVFPGETACIACLQGRISTRWGDEKPPAAPKITQHYGELVSELTKVELGKIKTGDTSLTNKTVSWNFQDRSIRQDQLLKVPFCPVCTENLDSRSGALVLPWS